MITKNDLVNDVVAEMGLEQEQSEKLKVILVVKLQNVILSPAETHLSTEVKDNDWIYRRFTIDMLAAGRCMSTVKSYVGIIKRFLEDTGLSYAAVTGENVTDYIAIRQYRDNISDGYKATIFKYISVFFKWAYRKHHIETDVMRDVDSIKTVQKKKERLSDEEVEQCRISGAINAKERALLELMLSAGPRIGEIVNLQVEDIDFKSNQVKIWGEKTKKERIGFLSPSCRVALLRYLNGRTTGYLFQGRNGGKCCKQTLEKMAKRMAERAGVKINVTVHTYRKTFASITYRKTGDIVLVAKLLGHASTATTIKYYLVDDVGDMINTMRKVA